MLALAIAKLCLLSFLAGMRVARILSEPRPAPFVGSDIARRVEAQRSSWQPLRYWGRD